MLSGRLRRVFCFFCIGHERVGSGLLDPDEDAEEIRLAHQPQQLVVVGQIDRGFGRELERVSRALLPAFRSRQERLQSLLVADEIVVDEIDMAAIAERVQGLELGQDLLAPSWCAARGRRAR